MHYYQHHIGDFVRDTARLTDSQSMAYLRLIWMYYDTEKPLPDDPEGLAFQVGASEQDVRLILKHYFEIDGDLYRHKRCDKELAVFKDKSEKAAKSANARWGNAKAMRTHTERIANERVFDATQEPTTKNQEPKKQPTVEIPFWLPKETWEAFVEMRKRIKKPMTDYAVKLMFIKLGKLRDAGHHVGELIDKSITNGWSDVYEPKGGSPSGVIQLTAAERLKRMAG
jgi:uncharacterized protein YdaU (DUF1376 family)